MTGEVDQAYLRKVTQEQDASDLQKKLKAAQMEANKVKVAENHMK